MVCLYQQLLIDQIHAKHETRLGKMDVNMMHVYHQYWDLVVIKLQELVME